MIIGVGGFSFANGSLASILNNYDSHNKQLQEKIGTLNKIYNDYNLPLDVYVDTKKVVEYIKFTQDISKVQEFIEELPHKLRVQLSLYVHQQRYEKIKFLKQ